MALTVLILAKNEEKHIGDCIKSAFFADEVLVIDAGSSDKTVEIAQNCGAKVIYHPMEDGFAAQRNFALEQTQSEWVMFLDADERIPSDLVVEIIKVINTGDKVAYQMPRRNISFGHWLKYGGWYPDYCTRLYPRTAVHYEGIVHERAVVAVPIKKLKQPLNHYTYDDWTRYFIKFNSYTTLMAEQNYDKGKRASVTDIVLRPMFSFFKMYILKSGWRDGKMGFIMAGFHGFYTMAKYVKLYYLEKGGKGQNEVCNNGINYYTGRTRNRL